MNKPSIVLNTILYGLCKQADQDQTIDPVQHDESLPFGSDLRYSNIGSALDRASKRKMQRMMLDLYKGPRDDAARLATHALAKEYEDRSEDTPKADKSSRNILGEGLGLGTGMAVGGVAGTGLGLAYRESFPDVLKPISPLIGAGAGALLPIMAGAFLATIRKRNPAQQVAYDQSGHMLSNMLVPGRAVYNDVQRTGAGDQILKSLSRSNG